MMLRRSRPSIRVCGLETATCRQLRSSRHLQLRTRQRAWANTCLRLTLVARAVDVSLRDSSVTDAEHELHVVSLRRPPPEGHSGSAAHLAWKWKEAVLGDGHDFFVPRPNTVRKLAAALVASSSLDVPIAEAVVLGNCRRFDVYVACSTAVDGEAVTNHVAGHVAMQIDAWRRGCEDRQGQATLSTLLARLNPSTWVDRDELVALPDAAFEDTLDRSEPAANVAALGPPRAKLAHDLSREFEVTAGAEGLVEYCCAVAMGLEGRAEHEYNPSSSRDAHIMLQLRRTLDAVAAPPAQGPPGSASTLPTPCKTQLSLVLRTGLEAGKASRSWTPDLPARGKLRGFSSSSGRYAMPVPRELAEAAAEEARAVVLGPAVKAGLGKLRALHHRHSIRRLRARVEDGSQRIMEEVGLEPEGQGSTALAVRKRVQQLLHEPTMVLREGGDVNEDEVASLILEAVEDMLQ